MSNPFAEPPPPETVFAVLDDPACRAIVRALDEPHTADELAAACDVSRSTVYRKLDALADASLVETSTDVRPDGHHATRYALDFEAVHVTLDDDRTLAVDIDRPTDAPDRIAQLWQEVREST